MKYDIKKIIEKEKKLPGYDKKEFAGFIKESVRSLNKKAKRTKDIKQK